MNADVGASLKDKLQSTSTDSIYLEVVQISIRLYSRLFVTFTVKLVHQIALDL